MTRCRAIDRVRYTQKRTTLALSEGHDRPDHRPGPDAQAITAALGRETVAALDRAVTGDEDQVHAKPTAQT